MRRGSAFYERVSFLFPFFLFHSYYSLFYLLVDYLSLAFKDRIWSPFSNVYTLVRFFLLLFLLYFIGLLRGMENSEDGDFFDLFWR